MKPWIVIVSFVALCFDSSAWALEKVTLQLQWKHQFQFAGFYAAKEQGYYEEAGLDVDFKEYQNGINIADEVLSGHANYGLSYASVIIEYLNGKPLRLLANYFKHSPHVLITRPEIKTPAMLKGKRIVGLPDNADYAKFYIMLERFGVKPEDVRPIPSTFDYRTFAEGQVDAMTVFKTNELYELETRHIPFNLFDPALYGPVYYDVNLFTSEEESRRHPERTHKFLEASNRGWAYALAHKEELIDLILSRYNTSMQKSREALRYEAREIEQMMMPAIHAIGSIDPERVRLLADSYRQSRYVDQTLKRPIDTFLFCKTDFCDPSNHAPTTWRKYPGIDVWIVGIILLLGVWFYQQRKIESLRSALGEKNSRRQEGAEDFYQSLAQILRQGIPDDALQSGPVGYIADLMASPEPGSGVVGIADVLREAVASQAERIHAKGITVAYSVDEALKVMTVRKKMLGLLTLLTRMVVDQLPDKPSVVTIETRSVRGVSRVSFIIENAPIDDHDPLYRVASHLAMEGLDAILKLSRQNNGTTVLSLTL